MSATTSPTKRANDMTWMRVLQKTEVTKPTWVTASQSPRHPALFPAKDAQSAPIDPLAAERAALAQAKRELEASTQAFKASIAALERAQAPLAEDTVSDLTELAYSVGRELAMRELQNDPTPVAELIRKLAAEMMTEGRLVVRVSLDDYPALMASDALSEQDTRSVDIVADSNLSAGSCVVDGKKTRVDASFEQRERAVRRGLSLAEEPRARDLMQSANSARPLQ